MEEIKENDILNQFYGIKKIEKEELDNYIKYRKLEKTRKVPKFWAILFGLIGIALLVSIIANIASIEDYESKSKILIDILFAIVFGGLFIWLATFCNKMANEGQALLKKINYSETQVYIARASSIKKEIVGGTQHVNSYRIKICDNHNKYIDKWFEIDGKAYLNSEIINGNIYLIKYLNENITDFISDYELYNI